MSNESVGGVRLPALGVRGWIGVGVLGVLFVTAYFLVAHFYDAEGGSSFTSNTEAGSAGVLVTIEPMSVDAQHNQASVHLTFSSDDPDLIDADERLKVNVRVLVQTESGNEEVRYPIGEAFGQRDVLMGIDGEQAQYPFDSHEGYLGVTADTYTRNADGSFTSTGGVFTSMRAVGGVNGWDTAIAANSGPASSEAAFTFDRAFSNQVFALLLLLLAVLLSLSALAGGLLAISNARRAEVGLLSWTAALLFALPTLRNFMPNGPPIGASIDIYIYLWVIVAAIVGALLCVLAWARQSRPRPAVRSNAATTSNLAD
jgi:hypothetical protein